MTQAAEVTPVHGGGDSHASLCSFMLRLWWRRPLALSDFLPEIDGCYAAKEEDRELEQSWHTSLWKAQGNFKGIDLHCEEKNISECRYETYNLSVYKLNMNIPFIWIIVGNR